MDLILVCSIVTYRNAQLNTESGPKLWPRRVLVLWYGNLELKGLFGAILIRCRSFLGVSVANCKDVSKNTFLWPLSMETPTKNPRSFHLRFGNRIRSRTCSRNNMCPLLAHVYSHCLRNTRMHISHVMLMCRHNAQVHYARHALDAHAFACDCLRNPLMCGSQPHINVHGHEWPYFALAGLKSPCSCLRTRGPKDWSTADQRSLFRD